MKITVFCCLVISTASAGKRRYFQRRLISKKLFVLGLPNVALYLAGFLIAIENVSAGLISLFAASNPLILIGLSSLILKPKLKANEITGMCIACAGLGLATIPGLHNIHATATGLLALIAGITSLSFGSIYFSRAGLKLPKSAVNAWQITFGGLLFIPMTLLRFFAIQRHPAPAFSLAGDPRIDHFLFALGENSSPRSGNGRILAFYQPCYRLRAAGEKKYQETRFRPLNG